MKETNAQFYKRWVDWWKRVEETGSTSKAGPAPVRDSLPPEPTPDNEFDQALRDFTKAFGFDGSKL